MKSMQLPKMSTHRIHLRRTKNFDKDENILKQQFNPPAPNRVWVSDITCIRGVKGHFYLCVIIDLFARKVIAWRVSSVSNAKFVSEVLLRAWNLRKRPKSVIFHSDHPDRGTQYTSKEFRQMIDRLGFRQSFSKPGYPYDNAAAEAFFKYLKKEETNRRKFCKLEEVKFSVMSYIDGYYNTKHFHEANKGLLPEEKEAEFWTGNE